MSRLRESAFDLLCLVTALLPCGLGPMAQALPGPEGTPAMQVAQAPPTTPVELSPEMRGDLLMARGEYAAAIHAYTEATPQTAVTWNKIGVAYHHLFALDEAMKDYKVAISLDPHYSGAYNNLGAVYHGKHEFSLAEKAYKLAIKYQPHAAVSYCNLGTTYFAESKYKKGVKAYRQAMEMDPLVFSPERRDQIEEGGSREQRMSTAFFLAEAYASSGKNEEALASLRKALSYGFSDRKRLLEDKELASLRKLPEFQELMVQQRMQ